MTKFVGLNKVKLKNGEYLVRISDGDMELDPISEKDYRLTMIKPDFDDLQEGTWLPEKYRE